MLKAGALVYALVMALIIGILSSSLVLYSWMNTVSIETNNRKVRLLDNVESGINLLLAEQEIVGMNEKKVIDLFGEGRDSVLLERRNWGVFEIVSASASWKGTKISRTGLAGQGTGSDSNTCFYLCERNAPLSVCGKTKLTGTCYLPEKGIRNAYIEGKNFIGDKPVNGASLRSKKELPGHNKELFNSMEDLLRNPPSGGLKNITELPDSVIRSFSDSTLVISGSGKITISDKCLAGNICIHSTSEVFISNTAQLDGILVFARKIRIQKGFTGSAQLFASDTIIVEENCRFTYPSVIGLVRTARSPDNVTLELGKNVSISGDLFAYEGKSDNRKQACIYMSDGDTIKGQIFSMGSLSLKGTVWGSVTCNKLVLKTSSAIYENHLLDVIIDRSRLSRYYVGMNTWSAAGRKKIIQWINATES